MPAMSQLETPTPALSAVERGEARAEACRAYLAAVRSPDTRSDDPTVRAAALVAVADAKQRYQHLGGKVGGQYSGQFAHVYDEARALMS